MYFSIPNALALLIQMALLHCFGEEEIFSDLGQRYVLGKECSSTASISLQIVDIAGENRVAWKKEIRAARCGSGHKALAAWDSACADDEFIVVCDSESCEKVITLAASLYRAFE